MPGLVLGHAFEHFERRLIDVGQRRMRHVAALRPLLYYHRQTQHFNDSARHSDTHSQPSLIAVGNKTRRSPEVGNPPCPQPRMPRLVGKMLGHLQLRIAVFKMTYDVEEQPRSPQFSVAIEAEDEDL